RRLVNCRSRQNRMRTVTTDGRNARPGRGQQPGRVSRLGLDSLLLGLSLLFRRTALRQFLLLFCLVLLLTENRVVALREMLGLSQADTHDTHGSTSIDDR